MRFSLLRIYVLSIIFGIYSGSVFGAPSKLPLGMNLPSNNYFATGLIYRDVMKTASPWIIFNASDGNPWSNPGVELLPLDDQGYPLELPYKVSQNLPPQGVRFLLNNNYNGRYIFTYDGEGEFEFNVPHEKKNGKIYLTFNGKGGHVWINIKKSKRDNHIRNIQILPERSANDTTTLFNPLFVEGLKPFHCLRFMDWMNTNGSKQQSWEQRSKSDYYSQGLDQGMSIDHAIKLCNLVHADAWLCVPHQASDDYIHRFAELVRDQLHPDLKVYLEYSNEIWNWSFAQAGYVVNNAPGALDTYVSQDLNKINPGATDHPEKDAYMMQRTFKIWSDVFGPTAKERLVRVAAVQFVWTDNTRRILQYLFKTDENGKTPNEYRIADSTGAGCDAVSPAGYFSYSNDEAKKWENMDPKLITTETIIRGVNAESWRDFDRYNKENARFARAWKVDFICYEGGQHMQPPDQKEWPFNNAIWEAQISPGMYDLYMTLFKKETSPEINCKLLCAYSYVGERKSRWGSWGHLENVDQLKDPSRLMEVAPKYQALLDANTPK